MLKCNSCKKQYPAFQLDCSLSVKPGCITGLIGQNGAGKSTIFKAILGLISLDSGSIELLGKEISNLTPKDKEKLGVVFPDAGFCEYLTPKSAAGIMERLYPDFQKAFFLGRCSQFGLPVNKRLKEFSTGMAAQFKVLCAISHRADFLVLDEPTAGLDVIARDAILNLLREFMEEDESRGILISSHISSDLETLCDDLYMIHQGHIIFHEDTDVLLSQYGLLKLTEAQYRQLDKQYILRCKKEPFGYSCLTSQLQYYVENYPGVAVEKGTIDETITMMIQGDAA